MKRSDTVSRENTDEHALAYGGGEDVTSEPADASGGTTGSNRLEKIRRSMLLTIVPLVAAMVVGGLLLQILGRDPIAFYGTMIHRAIISPSGFQETLIRMAPLLLIAAGLIVAFSAGIWNLGGDGQFMLGAALVGGLAAAASDMMPRGLMLVLMLLMAAIIGAIWTIIPALMKAYYGINEIITTLMMSFVGVNLAALLVKVVFLDKRPGMQTPRTRVLDVSDRLPTLFGTRVHVGVVIGIVSVLAVHFMMTRTSLGLRLKVLGANVKAARHSGLQVSRVIIVTFLLSGMFMGLAGGVEVLGVQGFVRADWNPAFGLVTVPLVFLARMNGWVTIAFVFLLSVLSIGGELATREASLPNHFGLLIVALVLLFMTIAEYFEARRLRGDRTVWATMAERLLLKRGVAGE
ncbi:MAG TPA: ABC transporter permease [Actinobacteria bacterium]|nr:beta-methylgalactoside transporter inner membrane component [bacterium BMS3Bbin01]HDH26784.1 ABC transporter permease [Actinomycetota bacterium]